MRASSTTFRGRHCDERAAPATTTRPRQARAAARARIGYIAEVNFVLHHFLATRDLGAPIAGAGAMLPDLWRMADRRVRPSATVSHEGASDDALVLAGVAHHVAVDRWFHADPVFTDGEREAADGLRASAIAAPRTVLFAHVLWELCLDGALIQRVGFGAMLGSLRAGITALANGAGTRAATRHHFDRVARSAEERAVFERRLARILDAIAEGPWIEGYQTGEGIAERVQGVRTRLGLAPMDAADLTRFAEVARGLLGRADAAVERVLSDAKAV
ncbi:Hypothetical protein A7982_05057 [Minicystis rosea]|nr:Hypothetical protein A7982_05057 [Minicystis rosea]